MPSLKVSTGIQGLDMMLGGGLPEGRVTVVIGGPGTGKTIFCSHFLHWGATKQNEKVLYISLDETKQHYLQEMLTFGWDIENLEKENKFTFADASGIRRIPDEARVGRLPVGGKELSLVNLIETIGTTAEKLDARRIVLDSVSGLIFRFPKAEERRMAVLDLVEALTATGATCLLTSEILSVGEERVVQPEEYLAQGVIVLKTLRNGERAVQIVKMRGAQVDTHPRPYMIKETGIEVYSTESIYPT